MLAPERRKSSQPRGAHNMAKSPPSTPVNEAMVSLKSYTKSEEKSVKQCLKSADERVGNAW